MICVRALHNTENYYHIIPSLPLCLMDNSTSVALSSHIVFSKHWVLFMAPLWPFASSPCSSKILLPDWTQYPGKLWAVWVEWKDYLIFTLIIIHNKNIRRKKVKQWIIQLSQMTVPVVNSLVLMRNWLETPGWSTSWIAAAKMAARISKSVKTACRAKWAHFTPCPICLSCLFKFISKYPISFLLGEGRFINFYNVSVY